MKSSKASVLFQIFSGQTTQHWIITQKPNRHIALAMDEFSYLATMPMIKNWIGATSKITCKWLLTYCANIILRFQQRTIFSRTDAVFSFNLTVTSPLAKFNSMGISIVFKPFRIVSRPFCRTRRIFLPITRMPESISQLDFFARKSHDIETSNLVEAARLELAISASRKLRVSSSLRLES